MGICSAEACASCKKNVGLRSVFFGLACGLKGTLALPVSDNNAASIEGAERVYSGCPWFWLLKVNYFINVLRASKLVKKGQHMTNVETETPEELKPDERDRYDWDN